MNKGCIDIDMHAHVSQLIPQSAAQDDAVEEEGGSHLLKHLQLQGHHGHQGQHGHHGDQGQHGHHGHHGHQGQYGHHDHC